MAQITLLAIQTVKRGHAGGENNIWSPSALKSLQEDFGGIVP